MRLTTGVRESSNDSERDISAWHFGGKMTFFEKVDVLAGVRVEDIRIESNNDAFVDGEFELDGTPLIFPSKYVLFDRFDNVVREFFTRPIFNDESLGIDSAAGNCRDANPGPGVDPPPGQSSDPRLDPGQRCVETRGVGVWVALEARPVKYPTG